MDPFHRARAASRQNRRVNEEPTAAAVALVDQIMAYARDHFPDKSEAWHRVWMARLLHYKLHDGDMTGAPDFPED
jgi:hypothetical protein